MKDRDPRTLTQVPPMVSFAFGAELLVRLGLVANMTREGVRRQTTHPDWPFGLDRAYPYWDMANADLMETKPFLDFFQSHPIVGRGPDREPGQRAIRSSKQK